MIIENKGGEKMTIYFDMDGTIANLYAVENWLENLRAENPAPYLEAKPMIDFRQFARLINNLQKKGYHFGIISWLCKGSSENYDKEVRKAKKLWLNKHLPSVCWDEIHLIKYGAPKHFNCQDNNGILFDDNEKVRELWKGFAFDENGIIDFLRNLL